MSQDHSSGITAASSGNHHTIPFLGQCIYNVLMFTSAVRGSIGDVLANVQEVGMIYQSGLCGIILF